jgi:hypothetical protein
MGNLEDYLDSLPALDTSPFTAVTLARVRFTNQDSVPSRLVMSALATLPRPATSAMGARLDEGGSVPSRSGAVSAESSVAGWSVVALT